MVNRGKLVLIPNVIAENTQDTVIPPQVKNYLPAIRHFLAEDIRTARRYLSSLKIYESIEDLHFSVLDKDTQPGELRELFDPVFKGSNLGVISESGCPAIADPGALAVSFAHENGIEVVPLVGPSSIILALMASGLNGQKFAFHGYLPIETKEAGKTIRDLERESKLKKQTQIFIETPYRNNRLFRTLLQNLAPSTELCVATDLTGKHEIIKTTTIEQWRRQLDFEIARQPAVFLFLA